MTNLETYCLRLFMSIKNGLGLLLTPDNVHGFGNDNVKSVNMLQDGLEAVIEFEGKEYKIRIIPL